MKNGREHDYEYSFIRKYFDMLMEKDVVCYSLCVLNQRISQMDWQLSTIEFIKTSSFCLSFY